MSFISPYGTSPLSAYLPATERADAALMNNLFGGIYSAALAQMGQLDGALGTGMNLWGYSGGGSYATPESYGRGLPEIFGAGAWAPSDCGCSGARFAGNGGIDLGALLRQQLYSACPSAAGETAAPTSESTTPAPASTSDSSSTSEVTPSSDACPSPSKKAFIVGDLVHFGRGDGTIRSGLKAMLNPNEGRKDGKNSHTHSKLSDEDAAKVRALLDSKDPEVMKLLKKKVPDKKSLVISEDGKLLGTLDTKRDVMKNSTLQMEKHKNGHLDRSAGGQIQIGDQTYDVGGTELHSPVKIALDGKDARLDAQHGFKIDLNGFGEKGGVAKTSGGLNGNEAWLVRDREGNGIVKGGVVDGNDVYGDHNGKVKDGYADLAKDFAGEVKVDPATGKRYIDLTAPGSRAGAELKLLDANGKLRPAKDILTRIDVDGTGADERDRAGNVITARANVTYRDGHTAESADQWFRTA